MHRAIASPNNNQRRKLDTFFFPLGTISGPNDGTLSVDNHDPLHRLVCLDTVDGFFNVGHVILNFCLIITYLDGFEGQSSCYRASIFPITG